MNQEGNTYRRLRALPAGAACQAIDYDLLQGWVERPFDSSGLPQREGGGVISASVVPTREWAASEPKAVLHLLIPQGSGN